MPAKRKSTSPAKDQSSATIGFEAKLWLAAAFTRTIQPMLDRIHANLHQSRSLATLRDTLLSQLLSGELSVLEVKREKEAAV